MICVVPQIMLSFALGFILFLPIKPLILRIQALTPPVLRFSFAMKNLTNETRLNHVQDPLSEKPVNCEDVMLYLDDSIVRARQTPGAYLIVIGRLGRKERNNLLNRMPLNAVESYIKRKSNLRYVIGEGSRVKNGLGRIEIYVGGRLVYVMPIKKNSRSFCTSAVG